MQTAESPDAIISSDSKGFITDWNEAAERLFGWRRDEIIGRSLAQTIVPEQHRQAHVAGLARYLATGTAKILNQNITITALRSDGTEIPISIEIAATDGRGPSRFTARIRAVAECPQFQ